MELTIEAKGSEQEKIKRYLEANASAVLAEKINNGVVIEKDGKKLVNKKTLDGFMCFANEKAQKQASKGARVLCLDDEVVYGWAIHYFEEDSITGVLYNEDGTEYKEPKKIVAVKPKTTSSTVKTPPTTVEPKMDLFAMAEQGVSEICEALENKNQGVQVETPVPVSSTLVKKKTPKGVSQDQMSLFDF